MKSQNLLYNLLSLEQVDEQVFVGGNLDVGSITVFGGQVLSQAVSASYKTIHDGKKLHSIHSYFLHPGDIDLPIVYEVESIKRGKSFDTRRVLAKQNNQVIFLLAASFHKKEEGIQHQMEMPLVDSPENLTDFSETFEGMAREHGIEPRGIFSKHGPFQFRPVQAYNPFDPEVRQPKSEVWFRVNSNSVPQDIEMKQAVTMYASDFNLLVTAFLPHGLSFFKSKILVASLDHAMWFYNEPELDDWMLYSVDSPTAGEGRALCQGSIFTRSGKLVARVMQEGLIRRL